MKEKRATITLYPRCYMLEGVAPAQVQVTLDDLKLPPAKGEGKPELALKWIRQYLERKECDHSKFTCRYDWLKRLVITCSDCGFQKTISKRLMRELDGCSVDYILKIALGRDQIRRGRIDF